MLRKIKNALISVSDKGDLKKLLKVLKRYKIKNISSVIFTHEHADQTNGLFELRPFFWKNKKKINGFADRRTLNY